MPDLTALIDAIAYEATSAGMSLREICDLFERRVLAAALSRTGGCVVQAARNLGVHRNTLHAKLRGRS